MPNANYGVMTGCAQNSTAGQASRAVHVIGPYNTNNIKVNTIQFNDGSVNFEFVHVVIFR